MYDKDELVKRLRSQCQWYGKECEECDPDGNCRSRMENEAADAIETLSKIALDEHNMAAVAAWKHRWIPVDERLPEDLQNVLVIDDGRVTIGYCEHFYGDEQIYVDWHDTLYYPIDPPYWMPLPEPQEE